MKRREYEPQIDFHRRAHHGGCNGFAGAKNTQAQSATATVGWPPAPTAKFVASTEKTFDQLMGEAMSVMHKGMHARDTRRS